VSDPRPAPPRELAEEIGLVSTAKPVLLDALPDGGIELSTDLDANITISGVPSLVRCEIAAFRYSVLRTAAQITRFVRTCLRIDSVLHVSV
jgi:hypothetical protein